jgi:hypothetical protein
MPAFKILWTVLNISVVAGSVADPHQPDPDPACHFNADPDPDPACYFVADPDWILAFPLIRIRSES